MILEGGGDNVLHIQTISNCNVICQHNSNITSLADHPVILLVAVSGGHLFHVHSIYMGTVYIRTCLSYMLNWVIRQKL